MKTVYFLLLSIGISIGGYAQRSNMNTSSFIDKELVKPKGELTQSFYVKKDQSEQLQINLRNRFSLVSTLKRMAIPVAAATITGLLKSKQDANAVEGGIRVKRADAINSIAAGVAIGGAINYASNKQRVQMKLTYRNPIGRAVKTENHWLSTKKINRINIQSPTDGYLDVTIKANKSQGLTIRELGIVENQKNLKSESDTTQPSAKDNPDAGTNVTQPCPDCPLVGGTWLPEVVVVGQRNDGGGSDGGQSVQNPNMSWGSFIGQYQSSQPSTPGFFGAMQSSSGSNAGGTYTGPLTATLDKSITTNKSSRVASFCNGRQTLWNWSYGNNNSYSTVEQAAYILSDGTMLTLPTQDPDGGFSNNTHNHCYYRTNAEIMDYTGTLKYVIAVPTTGPNAGKIQVSVVNVFTQQTKAIYTVAGYVHTHPFTGPDQSGTSYDIYNPSTSDPYSTDPNNVGDWQLSKDFGIPGYLITNDRVVTFHYDSTQSDPKRVTGSNTNSGFCTSTPTP